MAPLQRQSGLSLLEVLVAGGIGLLLLFGGGYIFVNQLRGYRDLEAQVKLQNDSKKAVEHMTREISNAGGLIPDAGRPGFEIGKDRLQVAYVDLRERYCRSTEKVGVTFRVCKGKGVDSLIQEITCEGRPIAPRLLIRNEGSIRLEFQYFGRQGQPTHSRALVQRVRFTLDLVSPKGKSLFQKSRKPQVDVDLTNY